MIAQLPNTALQRFKLLKLALRISGAVLLIVGGYKQALEIFRSANELHSNQAASVTVMVSMTWLRVAALGLALLITSFFLPRRRAPDEVA